jgi:hypothetical protein
MKQDLDVMGWLNAPGSQFAALARMQRLHDANVTAMTVENGRGEREPRR